MIVLKFKTIAKYQVTHLIENSNSKHEEISPPTDIKSSLKDTHDEKTKSNLEKLNIFLGSFEDKDRVKVRAF